MQDFDVEACDAKVLSATATEDGRIDSILDQTCFYARGGGQDWDRDSITKPGAEFEVEEVRLDYLGVRIVRTSLIKKEYKNG